MQITAHLKVPDTFSCCCRNNRAEDGTQAHPCCTCSVAAPSLATTPREGGWQWLRPSVHLQTLWILSGGDSRGSCWVAGPISAALSSAKPLGASSRRLAMKTYWGLLPVIKHEPDKNTLAASEENLSTCRASQHSLWIPCIHHLEGKKAARCWRWPPCPHGQGSVPPGVWWVSGHSLRQLSAAITAPGCRLPSA